MSTTCPEVGWISTCSVPLNQCTLYLWNLSSQPRLQNPWSTGVLIFTNYFHSSLPQQLKGACEALPVVPGQHPLWPQSKDQACCFSGFLYQVAASIYLSPNCRLYDTICISHTDLENIARLANSLSSGGTVTICPVRVSLAHLGSSGSTTFFLCTEKNARVIACLLRF